MSPPKPTMMDPFTYHLPLPQDLPQSLTPMSPDTSDTPESCRSNSTSPASSISPPMPRSQRFVRQDHRRRGPTSYVVGAYHSPAHRGLTEGGTISHTLSTLGLFQLFFSVSFFALSVGFHILALSRLILLLTRYWSLLH